VVDFAEQQAAAWGEIVTQMLADKKFYVLNGSVNGPGSSIKYTGGLREEFPKLLKKYDITSMIDAPCGDLTWISQTDLSALHSYIGYDVDRRIIDSNKQGFRGHDKFVFICTNLLKRAKFPRADMILSRDFLAHLTNDYLAHMLDKYKASGSHYLLASNYPGSSNDFVYDPEEYPWLGYMERPHDLTLEPFNLTRIDGIPEESPPGGVLANEHELALFDLTQ
jgi:hypothetical protein